MEKLLPATRDFHAINLDKSLCLFFFDSNTLSQSQVTAMADSWLSAEEKQTLDKRKQLTAKKEFIATRGIIKFQLARYFQLDAKAIKVHFDPQDTCLKAYIYQDSSPKEYQEQLPVQICISHSHGKVLVAMSRESTCLGVDLERRKPERPWLKLTRHFYHQEEVKQIEAGGVDMFYRIWTLKEALAKAVKQPIARLLSQHIAPMLAPYTVISGQYLDFDLSLITDLPLQQAELTVIESFAQE